MKNLLLALAITILAITNSILARNSRQNSKFGAVVSNGEACAAIGRSILQKGGSAIDAAISTTLCEGVTVPQSLGIGGGFTAVIYTKETKQISSLIAREWAPNAAHKDMFVDQNPQSGSITTAVPGELLGYWEMHQKYGNLPWKSLFKPVIKLCKCGLKVSSFLARALKSIEDQVRNQATWAAVFLKQDGSLYEEKEIIKLPKLCETLEIIAIKGVAEFYNGTLGELFAKDVQDMGGIITKEDLRDYRTSWYEDEHVQAQLTDEYTLYTTPLPTSGVLIAFMMNVLKNMYTKDQLVYAQRIVESFKHAYGRRMNLGDLQNDAEQASIIEETFKNLTSTEFAKFIDTLIFDDRTSEDYSYYGANMSAAENHGTANIAVIDAEGNAITLTSTINTYLGAKVISPNTGIIMNDEMLDFSTPGLISIFGVPPSPANFIKPHKRPMSSMCPSIVLDNNGDVRLLIGAAGGTRITTSVALTIIRYMILNQTLEEAITDGRFHHQLAPMEVDLEVSVPTSLKEFFEKIGHKTTINTNIGFSAVTGIGLRNNIPEPYFDPRRGGSTAIAWQTNFYC